VFYFFYAEIMATRKGDLIDVLNTTDVFDDDDDEGEGQLHCYRR
jgi:hypothetical protein